MGVEPNLAGERWGKGAGLARQAPHIGESAQPFKCGPRTRAALHLFETLPPFHRLQLVIETWNVPSWKLAERCGFVREGLMRSAGFGSGDPADCFLYARTRKDWREARHSPISVAARTLPG